MSNYMFMSIFVSLACHIPPPKKNKRIKTKKTKKQNNKQTKKNDENKTKQKTPQLSKMNHINPNP